MSREGGDAWKEGGSLHLGPANRSWGSEPLQPWAMPTLIQRAAAVARELGLEEGLKLGEVVRESNEVLELEPEGSVLDQFRR